MCVVEQSLAPLYLIHASKEVQELVFITKDVRWSHNGGTWAHCAHCLLASRLEKRQQQQQQQPR